MHNRATNAFVESCLFKANLREIGKASAII